MPFPRNISKEYLLKAIDKIDSEGIPSEGDSKYYDVLYNGKKYPPKVIVSFANIFANGEELDRNTFAGGLDTPCFKLLESNGFKIVSKEKSELMSKVKIYEIKSGASVNAPGLLSPDGKYFYWDNAYFKNNNPGDKIFFINVKNRWALFTELVIPEIPAVYNADLNRSIFNHEYNTYNVDDTDGRYKTFVRFDIIEKAEIPVDWKFTKSLGVPQEYYLWKEGIDISPDRFDKLDDLKIIFPDGKAFDELEKCRQLLTNANMLPQIIAAIDDKTIQDFINAKEFMHQLAVDKLAELINFKPHVEEDFYQQLMDQLGDKEASFIDFLNSFKPESDEYTLLKLIGEVVAYCDLNAANKKEFNQYPDKRVLALSFVRQTQWVNNLLKFKDGDNDPNSINSLSIRNAVNYLLVPETEVTMLAENHRKMVARYLLKTAYDKGSFVSDLLRFFEPYGINPVNPRNLTKIVTHILYRFDAVKQLWFEKIEGLVVCDNTGWIDSAITDLQNKPQIVIWWDKMPSGGVATQKLLREQIADAGFFYIYYTANQEAKYRARVVDFATESEYDNRNWNINEDVASFQKDFKDYIDEQGGGKIKKARIVFLADEISKLKTAISYDQIEFYKNYQPPTQNNMQPYAELKAEVEAAVIQESSVSEAESRSIQPTINNLNFDDSYRQLLMAMKTKPFMLLAGISGTGKSRLARTLAYKTCALKELQRESPENFLLVQVKPNWHDSTELLGYESRITGTPEYLITAFVRFLVKAWKYSEVPFILCLDEMNLAPVEQYFAEYLSAIESREYKNGRLLTDPLIPALVFNTHGVNPRLWKDLGIENDRKLQEYLLHNGLGIPQNLSVIGTVNMDETTHSFSRKVLDRAMTIEMNEVNIMENLNPENKDWQYPEQFYSPELVIGVHTFGGQVYQLFDEGKKVLELLEDVNKILDKTPFKIAYRVRDEALVYAYHNSRLLGKEINWLNTVMDEIIFMKILTRIEGDEAKTEKVIKELMNLLTSESYPGSNEKLDDMASRLSHGYTSFWP
ncbi:MAG: hypothetical protein ABIN74_09450 [Ferruginibacter sp.]